MLRHASGAAMAAAGGWLLWCAVRRSGATAPGEAGPPPLHPSLAGMAEMGPPVILFGLVVAAAQVVLAFIATEGGRGAFSAFDLAGFLALLVGYGARVKAKAARRLGPATAARKGRSAAGAPKLAARR